MILLCVLSRHVSKLMDILRLQERRPLLRRRDRAAHADLVPNIGLFAELYRVGADAVAERGNGVHQQSEEDGADLVDDGFRCVKLEAELLQRPRSVHVAEDEGNHVVDQGIGEAAAHVERAEVAVA